MKTIKNWIGGETCAAASGEAHHWGSFVCFKASSSRAQPSRAHRALPEWHGHDWWVPNRASTGRERANRGGRGIEWRKHQHDGAPPWNTRPLR